MQGIDREQVNIYKIIDEAMQKKDRYVTIYFGVSGTSVSVYPLYTGKGENECEA